MKRILPGLALILAPVSAQAQNWALADDTLSNQGAFFVDLDTIRVDGANRVARVLAVSNDDSDVVAAVAEMAFNCAGRNRILSAIAFNRTGRELSREGSSPWADIIPGSNYEVVAELVCRGWDGVGARQYGATPPIVAARAMIAKAPPPPE